MNISSASTVAKGTPTTARPMPPNRLCSERGHHHAEGHAADRLASQKHRHLAALTAQPAAETKGDGGGSLALGVHDRGDCDDKQELHEQPAQAPGGGSEPLGQRAGIRLVSFGARSRTPLEVSGIQAFVAAVPTRGTSASQSGGGGTRSDKTVRTSSVI